MRARGGRLGRASVWDRPGQQDFLMFSGKASGPSPRLNVIILNKQQVVDVALLRRKVQ